SLTVGNGSNQVGGLVGYGDALITQSYASETISAGGGAQYVGGLLGYGDTANTVSAVYAIAPISVGTASDSVGGLAGYNAGTISAAYATGSITTGAGTTNIGGFVGSNTGSITVSFWDTATSGLSVAFGSDTGTATATAIGANTLTTATYTGFDFTNDWYAVDTRTRPILRSEYATTIVNGHQLQLINLDPTAAYVLGGNIDMSGVQVQGGLWSTNGFSPIGFTTVGANASPAVFTGSLDGRGYTVNNLAMTVVGYNYIGLFSSIGATGSVINLALTGGTITNGIGSTNTNFGLLAGRSEGLMSNVSAQGTILVSRASSVGGLVGGLVGGTILNSYTGVTIRTGTAVTAVGGLAGAATTQSVSGAFAYISGSYATGGLSVATTNQRIGGLVGDSIKMTLVNSYATGGISTSNSGVQYTGGLVGINTLGTILNSYATGNLLLGNAVGRIGGLVGQNTGTVSGSYATGTITATGTGNQYVGGLVGSNNQPTSGSASALIASSYATGNVSVGTATATLNSAQYIGGLAGFMQNGVVSASYATGTVSVGRSASYVGGLVGSAEAYNLTMSSILGSYATGTVLAGSSATDIGGLAGRNWGSFISGAYATGAVRVATLASGVGGLVGENVISGTVIPTIAQTWASGTVSAPAGISVGGLVGKMTSGTVITSYWDVVGTNQATGYGTSAGGTFSVTSVSGASAFASASYGAFDFAATWYMADGYTRPILRAESRSTIINAHQLELIGANPTANYTLGANITMAELALTSGLWNTATGFAPIGISSTGNNTSPTAFTGTLNGQGYSISGMTIVNAASDNIGLFSSIGAGGVVSNLTLTNARISVGAVSGVGLVAGRNSGTISGVQVNGTVLAASGAQRLGGVAGVNAGLITAAYTGGSLSAVAAQSVGGIAGYNTGTIANSHALNVVMGGDGAQAVGGAVGYDAGTISASDGIGIVQVGSGAQSVGGLV
ncbi:beta strand repeat-containing protein, partial [Nitrospirillum viridazoti]